MEHEHPRLYAFLARTEVQAVISTFAAAVLVGAVAVVVWAIVGVGPPRLRLTDATWRWTGSFTAAGEALLVVPEPASYTLRLAPDGTFDAVADCTAVSGTYGTTSMGRAGGGSNGLTLVAEPPDPAPCGADSLADPFLAQLAAARTYDIGGSRLTIRGAARATMTFEAATPSASPTPGARR
jgi:hypothetical protein